MGATLRKGGFTFQAKEIILWNQSGRVERSRLFIPKIIEPGMPNGSTNSSDGADKRPSLDRD
jgi:hypothetical protein